MTVTLCGWCSNMDDSEGERCPCRAPHDVAAARDALVRATPYRPQSGPSQEGSGMTTRKHLRAVTPFNEAARLLEVQPGQPALALQIHHPDGQGRCNGCFGEHRQWPCFIAGLALMVRAKQDRAARRAERACAPLEALGGTGDTR